MAKQLVEVKLKSGETIEVILNLDDPLDRRIKARMETRTMEELEEEAKQLDERLLR